MVFVESSLFTRLLEKYLSDDEFAVLQKQLTREPESGKLIPGTSGLRKYRFPLPAKSKGRRGGVRIIYYWYAGKNRIYLLSLYYKGEVADLTPDDKRTLKRMVEAWKDEQT